MRDAEVDTVLRGTRVLVSLSARSLLAVGEDVTVPQLRVLVMVASRGPLRVVDVAEELQVDGSTATRLVDRLVRKHLLRRERSAQDARAVELTLTEQGVALLRENTARRRRDLRALMRRLDDSQRACLVEAMRAVADAAGEAADSEWALDPRGGRYRAR